MADYEVAVSPDIAFAEHDGRALLGDLYRPKGRERAPVLVALHDNTPTDVNEMYVRFG